MKKNKLGVGFAFATMFFAFVPLVSSAAINSLGGLTGGTQTFATSTAPNSPHLLIQSSGTVHTFKWDGTPWLLNQGGTGATSFATGSIPFINNGVFSENNSQLFWDAVNTIFSVGGSTSTQSKVVIKGSGSLNLFSLLASSTGTSLFSVNSTGSTTIANGVNITKGCFAFNGVCLATGSGSGTVASSTQGFATYYPLTGTLVAGTSTLFFAPSGNLGINTTSPQSALDIVGSFYSRLVNAGGSSIDWNAGNVQTLTLSSSPTLTFSNGRAGGEYKLILVQDGTGGRTVTWPGSVLWPGGTTPTLTSGANAIDSFHFIFDGASYLGSSNLNYGGASGSSLLTSIVSYWKLDESSGNVSDATANNNTLTNNNSATFTTGVINNATAVASASSQYFSISDASQNNLDLTGDFTVTAWVNFNATTTSGTAPYWVSKWEDGNNSGRGYEVGYSTVDSAVVQVSDGANIDTCLFSWTPSLSTWYFTSAVYDHVAKTVKFYVNGTQQGSTCNTVSAAIVNNAIDFRIAANGEVVGPTVDNFFDGKLDEIGIWSRVLSAGELSSLYNSGNGLQYPF